jgi:hypothetical protein
MVGGNPCERVAKAEFRVKWPHPPMCVCPLFTSTFETIREEPLNTTCVPGSGLGSSPSGFATKDSNADCETTPGFSAGSDPFAAGIL